MSSEEFEKICNDVFGGGLDSDAFNKMGGYEAMLNALALLYRKKSIENEKEGFLELSDMEFEISDSIHQILYERGYYERG